MKQPKNTAIFPLDIKFTIIELALAVLVIVIGFNGVVAMISSGVASKNRAIGQNGSTDALIQLLDLVENEIQNDWTWTTAFPTTKPSLNDSYVGWSSNPVFDNGSMKVDFPSDVLLATFDPETHQDGVFKVRQTLTNDSGAEYDAITSIARIWKAEGGNYTGTDGDLTLHAEISWPVEMPYAERSKEVFSLNIYKAPVITIASPEEGGGIATKSTDTGVVVQVTEVQPGSRIVNLRVTAATSLDGTLDEVFLSCPHSSLSTYSNSGSYTMETAYYSGNEGLLLSGIGLSSDQSFTVTYKLEADYVPDTTMVASTESTTGKAAMPVAFTKENFEYVYNATQKTNNLILFKAATSSFGEADGTVDIDVGLDLPSGSRLTSNLTVSIMAVDGGSAEADDYSFTTVSSGSEVQLGSVTFPKGSGNGTSKKAQIAIVDDADYESDESLLLALNVVTGNARVDGSNSLHSLTITNDDAAPAPDPDSVYDEEAAANACADTVSGTVLEKDSCDVIFGVDYVQISNTSNYPVLQVKLSYTDSKSYATKQSVTISSADGYKKILGTSGKKIDKMAFTRSSKNKQWKALNSDVTFCP